MANIGEVIGTQQKTVLENLVSRRHPGSIAVINYKGGVGKTTISCLLGYYLAEETKKKVLLLDIDPQCSLSLALGFDPDEVSKTELTIYNLVEPSRWTKITKMDFDKYAVPPKDPMAPKNLRVIRGAFDVDKLDIDIAQTLTGAGQRYIEQLHLYCKQMLDHFAEEYDYIIVDCPPNKMFLTQAMLRACAHYIAVTIPDRISVFGMPRLLRWVREIEPSSKPKLLGYILNGLNRTGGNPAGMVYSQQGAEAELISSIKGSLDPLELKVLGNECRIGELPRLDIIARFLAQGGAKLTRLDFKRKTSMQPSVDECLEKLTDSIIDRMEKYRAEEGLSA